MKKLTSLVLALAVSLALCIPALAAEPNAITEEVYDLGNGVTVTVGLADKVPDMWGRAIIGSSTTDNSRVQTYNMTASQGNVCLAYVWNDDGPNSGLRVSFDVYTNGEFFPIEAQTVISQPAYIRVESHSGSGLSGYVRAIINPLYSGNVAYSYKFDQSWK